MSAAGRAALGLFPGRADWRAAKHSPGRDLLAGLTVAIVALPLALAFGVASGLGAGAGITTAVIAGAVAAVFGGSNLQVSGLMQTDLPLVGALPAGIPAPTADFFDPARLSALLPSALAVAALAALESLLCATVADAMSVGQKHNPDRELLGQGLANLVVPLFGGVPATAAIARTAVNVRAGARSRLASLSHAGILLLFILVAGQVVGVIPLAALGGVLLATTVQMIQVGAIRSIVKKSSFVERVPLDTGDHLREEQSLLDERIVAFRLDGALFFGAAHRFLLELTDVGETAVVILRMGRLTTVDATGAMMLDDAITRLERKGIIVLLSGVKPGHKKVLDALGSKHRLTALGRVFALTPQAIAHARELVGVARD